MQKKQNRQPQLRIVGGRWRGRKLPFIAAEGLRPTSDRLRETLFNWLQWDVHDSNCLDLFAGSGALGFEAASRGAAHVVLVEKNAASSAQLEHNRRVFDANSVEIACQCAEDYLQTTQCKFDIAFVDPPFADNLFAAACTGVEASGVLAADALIYVEAGHQQVCEVPVNWQLHKRCRAGQVIGRLFRRVTELTSSR